jgi:hypothetical protein
LLVDILLEFGVVVVAAAAAAGVVVLDKEGTHICL